MSLNKLQNNFAKHIFNRSETAIIKNLPYSNQESLARLNIYRNNVFGNFSAVLSAIFAVVKNIIGDKKFQKLITEYQNKHHSQSGNLDFYGENFPKFLKKQTPAFLSDLAQLELYYHNCYFAPDVADFDVEKFKKLPAEKLLDLKFELHPSCFLMQSKFPIFSIWKNNGKKIPAAKKPEFALVERATGTCQIHKLSEIEFIFLENLSKGKALYQTYQKMVKLDGEDFDIGKILNKFITAKVISNYLIK